VLNSSILVLHSLSSTVVRADCNQPHIRWLSDCTQDTDKLSAAKDEVKECVEVQLYSVQNLLSSRLLSKYLKIKIYRTIILPVVLYGCESVSLTLRDERRPKMFENRVLGRVFGPKGDELTG
jgi:hypothetical protein